MSKYGFHEGWKNATTWAVALAIDNDKGLLNSVLHIFRYSAHNRLERNFREGEWRERICWSELVAHYSAKLKELRT